MIQLIRDAFYIAVFCGTISLSILFLVAVVGALRGHPRAPKKTE